MKRNTLLKPAEEAGLQSQQEHARMASPLVVSPPEEAMRTLPAALGQLLDRVQRLEDAVADLQVQPTVSIEGPGVHAPLDSNAILSLPQAYSVATRPTEPPSPAPALPVASEPSRFPPPPSALNPWVIVDVWADLRAGYRMFVDPHYSLGWQNWLLIVGLVLAIFFSFVWFSFLPGLIAWPLNKVTDLVLAYFLVKILTRESRRYRKTAPYLPASLRL